MNSLDKGFPNLGNPPKSPEELKFEVGVYTLSKETGEKIKTRSNQDDFYSDSKGAGAVFDGVGGRPAGSAASSIVRNELQRYLEYLSDGLSLEETKTAVESIFKKINNNLLLEAGEKGSSRYGMATTFSFVKFHKDKDGKIRAVVAHAGDSPIYVWRKNKKILEKLNIEDNAIPAYLQDKFDNIADTSELTDEEKIYWRVGGKLDNALGIPNSDFYLTIKVIDLEPDDIVIVASDGIKNLSNPEIAGIIGGSGSNYSIARKLAEIAKERSLGELPRSKPDDITVMLMSAAKQ